MQLEGQQFGQYRFLRLLRTGGMGEVYLADDERLQRHVAIKVIWTDTSRYADTDEAKEAARLFLREAQAIAQLDHMHILPVYDSGEENIDGVSFMFMVMPYRHEGSFTDWLRKRGKSRLLSLWDIERLVKQAASALQHAHNHQIIHQDVKPSNFLIHGDAEYPNQLNLQLADFGVAKFMTTTSQSQTIRGTPLYMAPEQWNGHPIAATDQYALAVMAYELLTGRPPFVGHNQQQMWHQHCHANPLPPSTFNSNIPENLNGVLLRALAKDPQDRFSSIAEFALAFREALLNSLNNHQTLIISPAEARAGTHRLVMLPDGRKLSVNVPAGAREGQMLRFEGQGGNSSNEGPLGALIITIAIKKVEELVTLSNTIAVEGTLPVFHKIDSTMPEAYQVRPLKGKVILLASLALILITGGGWGVAFTWTSWRNSVNITTTATANAATVVSNNTTTARNNMTSIALSNATSTARANATSTARANATTTQIAYITATARANVIATTQASATAQANAIATRQTEISLYTTAIAGTSAIDDSLKDNSNNYDWDTTYIPDYGGCTFSGGAYHSIVQKGSFSACFAKATNFSNFAYEIQMTIVKGDRGGIIFRANKDNGAFYYFHISVNGSYALDIYNNNFFMQTIATGTNSIIKTGLNQANLITVVAIDNSLNLYVNMRKVASVSDTTYSSGQIGVVAENTGDPTDVAFSATKVWTK
jgi:eukaryotic-like serine/threonine-protein kinase